MLTSRAGTIWLGRAARPYSFPSPTDGEPFALLLVAADTEVTAEEQSSLSKQFVRAGCRHAVCFGATSSEWDDSIDWVKVTDKLDGREEPFVMTSWFADDPVDEAVGFFADFAGYDGWTPRHFVTFVLGGDERLEREVEQALLSRFG